jgi:peptidoglycan hydrolase-like amidase
VTTRPQTDASERQRDEVRVGIVLPVDGAAHLRLVVPDAAYYLTGGASETQPIRGEAVECHAAGDAVRVSVGDRDLGNAAAWTLQALEGDLPLKASRDADRPAVRVDGVVAGRGFHWQGTTQQSLPGTLTLRSFQGRLTLAARLPLDEYLAGVITAEMSGRCPMEFLKAQCVVARSWTLACSERKHDELGVDLCNDDCCQRYQGSSDLTDSACRAVCETSGEVLLDESGAVVDANYSKSCGGIVEAPEAVWGAAKVGLSALVDAPPPGRKLAIGNTHRFWPVAEANVAEYLAGAWLSECDAYCSPRHVDQAAVPDYLGRVDRGGSFFRWTVRHERSRLEEILRSKAEPADSWHDFAELDELVVTQRGVSGRAIALELAYRDSAGRRVVATINDQYRIRQVLHDSFLYSSAFSVRVDRDAGGRAIRFHLDGAGWGHGTGLCQIGALGMALAGHDYRQILAHYFPAAGLADLGH